ncbi:unnamed protein product [Brassicogethes aeneus]|uniref:Uncharacterized protein n=1 Tax=Brassicogethes aeneus TaxID=1431903 RepID=A0A9P0BJQ7_BRAAE|nr:unnamed protein product [Brassicogethes aeneus]
MKEDTNFSRRMVLSKFSNTPPFHMKSNETFSRGESLRKILQPENPDYCNENDPFCECGRKPVHKHMVCSQSEHNRKNSEKCYVSRRKHQSDTFPQSNCPKIDQPAKNISRKEMVQQKPNNNVVPRVLENFKKIEPRHNYSEPVVPRNSIGKNIPSHSVMTNLLGNLIKYDNTPEKNFHSQSKAKKYAVINQSSQSYPSQFQRRRFDKDVLNQRIDKYTSTTGLHWAPECNNSKRITQNYNTKLQNKAKPKCPMACHRNLVCKNKRKSLNETIEILDSASRTNIIEYMNPNICTSNSSEFEHDFIKDLNRKKKTTKKNLSPVKKMPPEKTKSFVRLQVDRYNRMVQGQDKKTQNCQKNHTQFMNSVKEKVPRIIPTETDQFTESQDWSDTYKEEIKVCFPKETKQAMEKLMDNKTRKTSVHRQARRMNPPGEEERPSLKPNCKKLSILPCHKNLLCNRGFHIGECVS